MRKTEFDVFANGAVTAALAYAVASAGTKISGSQLRSGSRTRSASLELSIVDDGGHLTTDQAALASFKYNDELYLQTTSDQEVTGLFFENESNGRIYFTEGGLVSTNFKATIRPLIPASLRGIKFNYVSDFHTHPFTAGLSQERFSRGDNIRRGTYPRYLRTPLGDARVLRSFNRSIAQPVGLSICPTPNCLTPHPSTGQ